MADTPEALAGHGIEPVEPVDHADEGEEDL
jgi:hypothetical protein